VPKAWSPFRGRVAAELFRGRLHCNIPRLEARFDAGGHGKREENPIIIPRQSPGNPLATVLTDSPRTIRVRAALSRSAMATEAPINTGFEGDGLEGRPVNATISMRL